MKPVRAIRLIRRRVALVKTVLFWLVVMKLSSKCFRRLTPIFKNGRVRKRKLLVLTPLIICLSWRSAWFVLLFLLIQ